MALPIYRLVISYRTLLGQLLEKLPISATEQHVTNIEVR